jgi:hypothetical protein
MMRAHEWGRERALCSPPPLLPSLGRDQRTHVNALVVADEVPRAIENELPPVDLKAARVVAAVAVDDVDASLGGEVRRGGRLGRVASVLAVCGVGVSGARQPGRARAEACVM